MPSVRVLVVDSASAGADVRCSDAASAAVGTAVGASASAGTVTAQRTYLVAVVCSYTGPTAGIRFRTAQLVPGEGTSDGEDKDCVPSPCDQKATGAFSVAAGARRRDAFPNLVTPR